MHVAGRLAIVATIVAVAACAGPDGHAPAAASLTIYAAASLEAAMAKAVEAYAASNPGTTLALSVDSSAALETKIEQGAAADVFLSADQSNPQKLVDAGLTIGPVVPFAGNGLAIVVPSANPAGIRAPSDLARPGLKIVAAGGAVPITAYASRLVSNLASLPGYPAQFVTAYETNVVSREDNVAAVLAKVELGEGDAGIVYATDARASGKVATIPIPAGANVRATYGGVVVRSSRSPGAAAAFLTWLAGPAGQAVLSSFGFLPSG